MPSPTPELIQTLIERVGEDGAMRWLGRWSTAILDGHQPPRLPRRMKPLGSTQA